MINVIIKMVKNKISYLIAEVRNYPIKLFAKKYIVDDQLSKTKKYMLIDRGAYHYPYFNMSALKCLAGNMLFAFYKGYIPYVDLAERDEGEFNWDVFFRQPFENRINPQEIIKNNMVKQKFKVSPYYIRHKFVYDRVELGIWSKIFKDFVVFNEKTEAYIQNEYNNIMPQNSRVLGVVCRGTDYIVKKPSGHPVQPTPEYLIKYIDKKLSVLQIDFIYLATEEKRILDLFEESFPGKILTNNRTYYDEIYYSAKKVLDIGDISFERENDNYWKGIEYLSSVYILSKCVALIGGNCGAAQGAIYLNNHQYEFCDLINLGLYE
ncbi:MAG: hypothetical protein PHQ65_07305 [Bacteroidales bacterium]|nr:hypothetical protein [Bacteroidales bacterium]